MRRWFCHAAVFFALSLEVSAATSTRPNVLFISVDDMNSHLGTYGHSIVKSPNIDRLAARGVRFDRAYCQYAFCAPSRASVLTGLRPDQTKVYGGPNGFRQAVPDAVTLPQLFRNAGYVAARVGKVFHYSNPQDIGTNGKDDPASWDEVSNPAGVDKTTLEPEVINLIPSRKNIGSGFTLLADTKHRDEEHTDGMVATEAIRLMEKNRAKPFFIAVGFFRPHAPYVAPKKYFDLYPLEQIQMPIEPEGHKKLVPAIAIAPGARPFLGASVDDARRAKQAYYASISFVDAQIGRVLDALDRLGLRDNTIVVFWSDHGYHVGEHGLWLKTTLFEEAARVPLIVAAPGSKARGQASPRTVELVDLYPTLADLAGLKRPANLAGASLRSLLDEPKAEWTRAAYTQLQKTDGSGHSVRTERWRYTEWAGGEKGAQLYDHDKDPREYVNLAGDPAHAGVIVEMKSLIRRNFSAQQTGVTIPSQKRESGG